MNVLEGSFIFIVMSPDFAWNFHNEISRTRTDKIMCCLVV